jgi:hypothetical protein
MNPVPSKLNNLDLSKEAIVLLARVWGPTLSPTFLSPCGRGKRRWGGKTQVIKPTIEGISGLTQNIFSQSLV